MAPTVSLVAMPWALADRPSIQLATLKAYLERQLAGTVTVRAHHPYLAVAAELGLPLYQAIAEQSWVGEALYAAILFPQMSASAAALAHKHWRSSWKLEFDAVGQTLSAPSHLDALVDRLADSAVVGFTVCFAQLNASLLVAERLKRRHPAVSVVFGGSMVCEAMGRSLLEAFPQIDYIVNGEGERPFTALVHRLMFAKSPLEPPIAGVFFRTAAGQVVGGGRCQVASLDSLPVPDFGDFFRELQSLPSLAHNIVQLLVEGSRGCWWHRSAVAGRRRACRFCNLNLQWNGYRAKPPQRLAAEIAELSRRHRSPRLALVDNTLPRGKNLEVFERIAALHRTLHLFVELRVPIDEEQARAMRLAGVEQVQVGIEALSNRLLQRMGKGTRAIDNIAAMKWCEQFGIANLSNLLLEFPGSGQEEVAETLRALDVVGIYQPLRAVRFWLGEGSEVQADPKRFGLSGLRNHRGYRALFPSPLADRVTFMVKEYRGDQERQRRLWAPVRLRLRQWRRDYLAARRAHFDKPLLGYSDGGDYLVIRRRMAAPSRQQAFRLAGRSRAIYLYCREPRTLAQIQARFGSVRGPELYAFIEDLCTKQIMFKDRLRVLSLAVDEDIRRFCGNRGPHDRPGVGV